MERDKEREREKERERVREGGRERKKNRQKKDKVREGMNKKERCIPFEVKIERKILKIYISKKTRE